MSRGHTPFGYRIEGGAAVICEEEAEQIRKIYEGYLGGLSLINAAAAVGINKPQASIKRLIWNPHYLGDDYYPAIIDKETYTASEAERKRRMKALGRDRKVKEQVTSRPAPTEFRMHMPEQILADPYKQAAYIYSLIESEG